MVQLRSYEKLRPDSGLPITKPTPAPAAAGVKLEIEDQLEDEHGPLDKRPKMDTSPLQPVDLSCSFSFLVSSESLIISHSLALIADDSRVIPKNSLI